MVHPLRAASGLIGRFPPVGPLRLRKPADVPSFLSRLVSALRAKAEASGPREDAVLLSQVLACDSVMRDVLRREVDRPTPARPERLQALLRKREEPSAPAREAVGAAALLLDERKDPDTPAPFPPIPLAPPPPPSAAAGGRPELEGPAAVPLEGPAAPPGTWAPGPAAVSKEPDAASAEIVDRAAREEAPTPSRGVARLRLVLTPPDLGELRLDLVLRRSTLQVALQAERASAAEAILAQLPALREALERRGVSLGELTVSSDGDPARRGPPARAGLARIVDLKA